MFLSRVQIDTNNRRKLKPLTHLGAYHNWVEQSFPEEVQAGERPRHLWRIDQYQDHQFLLILSQNKPSLEKMEEYGVDGTAETKNYDPFLSGLEVGQHMRFRLCANPTKAIKAEGERGRVVPQITVAQQMNWLSSRAETAGFRLLSTANGQDFRIIERGYPILRREHGRPIRLSRVTFEGRLAIIDGERFNQSLVQGIGKEKAYGMGLLTVIPEKR